MNKSENIASVTRENQFEDELSLLDLVAFIRRNLRTLFGGALLGGILGLAIAFAVPAKWEASALVRIGQLGSNGSTGSVVEPALQTIDRITNKSFQNDVLKSQGLSTSEDDAIARNFRDTLKVKLEKSGLISLAVRADSPEKAKLHMSAVINEIKAVHVKMIAPTINRWYQELKSVELELKRASMESDRLENLLNGQSDKSKEKSFAQATLLGNLLFAREGEQKSLRDRKRMLEEQLSPERTFTTQELGRVEVSEKPVFPKKSLFIVAGLFLGLLLGVLFSMLKLFAPKETNAVKKQD